MSKSFLPQQTTTPPAAVGLGPPGASLVGGDNAFNASLLGAGQFGAFAGGFGLSDARDGMKDALNVRENEEELDAREEQEDFLGSSFAPVDDFTTATGAMFDAAYDPATGFFDVTVRLKYDFDKGDPSNIAPGYRPEEFDWTSAEMAEWKSKYHAMITSAWSGAHVFASTKPHWDLAVKVRVNAIEDSADPHFVVALAKYPPDAGSPTSSVCAPGTHHDGPDVCDPNDASDPSGAADLDSGDLRRAAKQAGNQPTVKVQFRRGKSELDADGKAAVAPVATDLASNPNWWVRLRGHSSKDHRDGVTDEEGAIENMDLARKRTESVHKELGAAGVDAKQFEVENVGEQGATDDPSWCRSM